MKDSSSKLGQSLQYADVAAGGCVYPGPPSEYVRCHWLFLDHFPSIGLCSASTSVFHWRNIPEAFGSESELHHQVGEAQNAIALLKLKLYDHFPSPREGC
jgi:hypothetical protein